MWPYQNIWTLFFQHFHTFTLYKRISNLLNVFWTLKICHNFQIHNMYTILVFSHMVDRFATMKNSISISKSTPSSKIVNTPLPPVPITSTSSFTQTVNCQPSTSIVPGEILKWYYSCLIQMSNEGLCTRTGTLFRISCWLTRGSK